MQTAKTDRVLILRQQGIGERLEIIMKPLGMRDFMRKQVKLWTTLKQPPNPFPIDKNHGRNNDNEDAVLLAAAYQCFYPHGEPIMPAWFDLEEYPTRQRWCVLIELVGKLDPNYLSYIDETLAAFATKHAPVGESTTADNLNLCPSPATEVTMPTSGDNHGPAPAQAQDGGTVPDWIPGMSLADMANRLGNITTDKVKVILKSYGLQQVGNRQTYTVDRRITPANILKKLEQANPIN